MVIEKDKNKNLVYSAIAYIYYNEKLKYPEFNISKSRIYGQYNLYTTTGTDLDPIKSDRYDFIMSTTLLQAFVLYSLVH